MHTKIKKKLTERHVDRVFHLILQLNLGFKNSISFVSGIDFKIKTVELGGKKIKLQIW